MKISCLDQNRYQILNRYQIKNKETNSMLNKKNHDHLKVGVVGAGSWGTALANLLAVKGYVVDHWVFEKEVQEEMTVLRENKVFLPGFPLSANLNPSNDLAEVVTGKNILLFVVPSHVMRETLKRAAKHIATGTILVSASKGIENTTHLTMTGIFKDIMPSFTESNFAVLSGPSFAKEVAADVPTAVVAASKNIETAAAVQNLFATPCFRVYTGDDIIGVELGGAIKNVMAIATGIVDGLKLGLNTRAALITRGLAEIRRLGVKLGANPHTFSGLAGAGDLILTCTGNLSRNYTVGEKIGAGKTLPDILNEMRMVAEGVKTAKSVYNLSRKLGIEMPIAHEIYQILYEDHSPREAVWRLMTRDLKQELDPHQNG
jgi:glycerol-3-phosphate dehydrogenase (NAD(P)+)